MVHRRALRRVRSFVSVVVLTAGLSLAVAPDVAADTTDGTLTVIVDRDVVGTGVYDSTLDNTPVAGIPVTVTMRPAMP